MVKGGTRYMAVVVITGASSGIGAATARVLAKAGHSLVLAARRTERLEQLAGELSGSPVCVVPTDVTIPEQVSKLADLAVERFGRIDVWINNAGVGHPEPWWEADAESLAHVAAVNLNAVWLGSQAALRYMLPQERGQIINVASVAGHIGTTAIYSATKFGVVGFSEALRRELRHKHVQVCIVSPGFVKTEMTANVRFPMPPPETVGRAIARLIRHSRREIIVPRWYRLLIILNIVAPGLVDRILSLTLYRR